MNKRKVIITIVNCQQDIQQNKEIEFKDETEKINHV